MSERLGIAMEKDILLEVKHLHTDLVTKQKTIQIVNDVSFCVMRGETFGLIGESGCGKSITCKSLIQLMREPGRITAGEILYKGENLLEYSEKKMQQIRGREISMIFQNPMTTLNPVMTIGSQLIESMEKDINKKEKAIQAEELLRLTGIPDAGKKLKYYPHQFSGGMRQRAMIAIALAARPHLLLADEPTTALDVSTQRQIIKLLKQLKKELDMSLLLVTHDLSVASEMCDRIAVMYAGCIMEMTDTASLFKRPLHPYTYGLLQSIPSIERKKNGEKLYSIGGYPPEMDNLPEGCPFSLRCNDCEPICKKDMPKLIEVEKGHFSRCHCMDKMLKRGGLSDV